MPVRFTGETKPADSVGRSVRFTGETKSISGEELDRNFRQGMNLTPEQALQVQDYRSSTRFNPDSLLKGAGAMFTQAIPEWLKQVKADFPGGVEGVLDSLSAPPLRNTLRGATSLADAAIGGTSDIFQMGQNAAEGLVDKLVFRGINENTDAGLTRGDYALSTLLGREAQEQNYDAVARGQKAGPTQTALSKIPGVGPALAEYSKPYPSAVSLGRNFLDPTMLVPPLRAAKLPKALQRAEKAQEAAQELLRKADNVREKLDAGYSSDGILEATRAYEEASVKYVDAVKAASKAAEPGVVKKGVGRTGRAAERVGGTISELADAALDKYGRPMQYGGAALGALGMGPAGAVIGYQLPRAVRALSKSGEALGEAGSALRSLADVDWSVRTPAWEQIAKNKNAPSWLRESMTKNFAGAPVGKRVTQALSGLGAAGRGAVTGAAIGGGLMASDLYSTGDAIGGGLAVGGVLGAGGGVAGRYMSRDRRIKSAILHDSFIEANKALDAGVNPLLVASAPTSLLSSVASLRHLTKGLFGENALKIELLDGEKFAEAVGQQGEPGAGAFYDPATNRAVVNLNTFDAEGRLFHEVVGHAVLNSAVGKFPHVKEYFKASLTPEEIVEIRRDYARALEVPEESIDQFLADMDAKDTITNGDWIYSELFAEAAANILRGADLVEGAKVFGRTPGVTFFKSPAARKIIQSDSAKTLVQAHMRDLRDFRPGLDEAVEPKLGLTIDDAGKHPAFGIRQDVDGSTGNDFVVQTPDGRIQKRPLRQVKKRLRTRRKEVKELFKQDELPVDYDEGGQVRLRRTIAGKLQVTGRRLGERFYAEAQTFSDNTKGLARRLEEAIDGGDVLAGWYHEIGQSSPDWGQSVSEGKGNLEAQYKDFVPFGFLVSSTNNILVQNYSLTAFYRKALAWSQRQGDLSLDFWNGNIDDFTADVKTYLRNHQEGKPGSNEIGDVKRNVINAFMVGSHKTFEDANPLRARLSGRDRQGIVRSYRLDRLETLEPSQLEGFSTPQYNSQVKNLSPKNVLRLDGELLTHRRHTGNLSSDYAALMAKDGENSSYGRHTWITSEPLPEVSEDVVSFASRFYGVGKGEAEKLVSPENVVDNAGAWDDVQFVSELWQEMESGGMPERKGFMLPDGAVVLDKSILNKADTDYSSRLDTDYLRAVESGDMDSAQRMVDEAAKAAGYTHKAWHDTNADKFNVFDLSRTGSAQGGNTQFYDDAAYFTIDGPEIRALLKSIGLPSAYGSRRMDVYLNLDRDKDYIPNNAEDGTEVGVTSPERIKSADPVTFDDNGAPIPLSERFNELSDDIRYSPAVEESDNLPALNVRNEPNFPYADQIVDGEKTIETRRQPNLDSLIGKTVKIIRTSGPKSKKPAMVIGEVTVAGKKEYRTAKEFRRDAGKHRVSEGSEFDFSSPKIGYVLKNPKRYVEEYPARKNKGIVMTKSHEGSRRSLSDRMGRLDTGERDVLRKVDTPVLSGPGRNVPTIGKVRKEIQENRKAGVKPRNAFPQGKPVGLRLDIPTYLKTIRTGEPVFPITVHERWVGQKAGKAGKVLGYTNIAKILNPSFNVNEKAAFAVQEGRANKSTFATVEGVYDHFTTLPEDIGEWAQVAMNPRRHSYFYDRQNFRPVVSGSEAIVSGSTVFVKDPVYGEAKDFLFSPKLTLEDVVLEDQIRKIDTGDKGRTQVGLTIADYPENVDPTSVALPARMGVVNKKIKGVPSTYREVVSIVKEQLARMEELRERDPEFARRSANFYSDMARTAFEMAAHIRPSSRSQLDTADLMIRLLALGSPRSSVSSNSSKSVRSVDAPISGKAGFKIGMGTAQLGALRTAEDWHQGKHFDVLSENAIGADDKVRNFYLNAMAELIDDATEAGHLKEVRMLQRRVADTLGIQYDNKFTPSVAKKIQKFLDGLATVDMWDMAAKGYAHPAWISPRGRIKREFNKPFHWSIPEQRVKTTFGSSLWSKALGEAVVMYTNSKGELKKRRATSPMELDYQYARAFLIDGRRDWNPQSWEDRKLEGFTEDTEWSYFKKKDEGGLSPGGSGPVYDAQQMIDGLIADEMNRLGLAEFYGKTQLKARNAQEILWAIEKLDNPTPSNRELVLFGDRLLDFPELLGGLFDKTDAYPVTEKALRAFELIQDTYNKVEEQAIPIEVTSGGSSLEASQVQGLEKLVGVGAMTEKVADGFGDEIQRAIDSVGGNVLIKEVKTGVGGYQEDGKISTSPNITIGLKGDPDETFKVMSAISQAWDQDGGNVIRKPSLEERARSKELNAAIVFDTRSLNADQKRDFYTALSSLKDSEGNTFLTGFTETPDGMFIGDQWYSGDMLSALEQNADAVESIMDQYGVPSYKTENIVIETFNRQLDPVLRSIEIDSMDDLSRAVYQAASFKVRSLLNEAQTYQENLSRVDKASERFPQYKQALGKVKASMEAQASSRPGKVDQKVDHIQRSLDAAQNVKSVTGGSQRNEIKTALSEPIDVMVLEGRLEMSVAQDLKDQIGKLLNAVPEKSSGRGFRFRKPPKPKKTARKKTARKKTARKKTARKKL